MIILSGCQFFLIRIYMSTCGAIDAKDPPHSPLYSELSIPRQSYAPREEYDIVGLNNQGTYLFSIILLLLKFTSYFIIYSTTGATCYMNSLLQSLFHIGALRHAVFQLPIVDAPLRSENIPWQLQRLFYLLQTAPTAPDTKCNIALSSILHEIFYDVCFFFFLGSTHDIIQVDRGRCLSATRHPRVCSGAHGQIGGENERNSSSQHTQRLI